MQVTFSAKLLALRAAETIAAIRLDVAPMLSTATNAVRGLLKLTNGPIVLQLKKRLTYELKS